MQRSSDALTRTLRAPNLEGMRVRQAQARRQIPRLVLMVYLAVLAASQAFLPSAQAGAGPCRVPSNAYPTIQAAVNNTTCPTINVAAGTYAEHVTIARDVMIRGSGQDSTVVDGGSSGRVVTVAGGTVTIRGVTIQNGRVASVNGNLLDGGGIFNAGTLTIENSTFADNSANDGGGIFNFSGGMVMLTDVTFQNNIPNDCTGCPGLL